MAATVPASGGGGGGNRAGSRCRRSYAGWKVLEALRITETTGR